MLYRKVKVSCTMAKDRLYRVFYVPQDLNLESFADLIQIMFRAEFEHLYCFRAGKVRYVTEQELENMMGYPELMKNYSVSDLGPSFKFFYDYGDGWEFDVRVFKAEKEFAGDRVLVMKDGKGMGLFEDNIHTFSALIAGAASPGMRKDNEIKGFFMPWNLEMKRLGDFDKPLDLEAEEAYINERFAAVNEDPATDDEVLKYFADAVNAYKKTDTEEDFFKVIDVFAAMVGYGLNIPVAVAKDQEKEDEVSVFSVSDGEEEFLVTVTSAAFAEKIGADVFEMPADALVRYALSCGADGICVDTGPDDEGVFIGNEALQVILDAVGEADDGSDPS